MNKKLNRRDLQAWTHWGITALTATLLLAVLSYTFTHTGKLLSRNVEPYWVGYVTALGIEGVVALMAYRLATSKTKSGVLKASLIAALVMSTVANLAEGHYARTGAELTWSTIPQLDLVVAFVWISANALVSFLVFAMSELIGTDIEVGTKKFVTTEKASEQPKVSPEVSPEPQAVLPNYRDVVYNFLRLKPQATLGEIMSATGIASQSTASKWRSEWRKENGNSETAHTEF